ncbi:hypothetical protein [Marinibactrum halimedae]|uniref:Uncharacterized protein n=1 Tax=Marinibactrum halimedae TaxID=1444977 RepID=A0AA37T443_9GAMM|nr:hypothetical protein [Marinibactrum halimedae]MCD9461361.1 hypothetical protein [Marinibactrum halimedae]GLS26430.1 hypothetical protein GCM10007877_21460 [Marinibactrum halimedae]
MGGFGFVGEKYTNCNYFDSSKPYENCGIDFMLFVDLKNQKVSRINNHDIPEIGVNSLMETGGLQGYDSYGCYINFALQSADVDLDGRSEVFFFGGVGDFEYRGEGKNVQTTLKIYSGSSYKNIFSEEMSYENFVGEDVYSFYLNSQELIEYQYISNSMLDSQGMQVQSKIEPSVRRFAKFYFLDVDKNGLLDILVWRKILTARKRTDSVKGYELAETEYARYEEGFSGFEKIPMGARFYKKFIDYTFFKLG